MPIIQIPVSGSNFSAQVGDILYSSPTTVTNGFTVADDYGRIGPITAITATLITADMDTYATPPAPNDFLLFTKDNTVNSNGVLGYYALVKMQSNATTAAELFSVGTEFFESSK